MLTKKYVEKEVEVTVLEKRTIPLYCYDDDIHETKEELKNKLMWRIHWHCNRIMEEQCYNRRCKMAWDKVKSYGLDCPELWMRMFNSIKEELDVIEELDSME